jgi:hypothetical protein
LQGEIPPEKGKTKGRRSISALPSFFLSVKDLRLIHLAPHLPKHGGGQARGVEKHPIEGALVVKATFKGNITDTLLRGKEHTLGHGNAEGIDQKSEIAVKGGGNNLGNIPFAVPDLFGKALQRNILGVVIVKIHH